LFSFFSYFSTGFITPVNKELKIIIRRNVYFGPKQHSCTLQGDQIAPSEGTIFRGKDIAWHARRHSAVSCAKMAEKNRDAV